MLEVETAWTCCERWQFGKLTSLFSLHRSDWHQCYRIFDHQYWLEGTHRNRKEHIILGPCFFILCIAKFPLLSENPSKSNITFYTTAAQSSKSSQIQWCRNDTRGANSWYAKGPKEFRTHVQAKICLASNYQKHNTYVTYIISPATYMKFQ